MFAAIAVAMALLGPVDDAEAAAAPPGNGFVLVGAFRDDDNMQFGFADMTTYRRTGDLVDVWENWMLYRPVETSQGRVAYYRRRFTFDCVRHTDRMTEVKSISTEGKVLRQAPIDNPPDEPIEPGTLGVPTLAFLCEGAEPPYGLLDYPTWDEAVDAARHLAEEQFGAGASPRSRDTAPGRRHGP